MSSSDDEEEENDIASTSDSSDEQNEWHLDEDLEGDVLPLLNITSFGWTEDGRCSSYAPKIFPGAAVTSSIISTTISSAVKSVEETELTALPDKKTLGTMPLTQICPRPIASLRAAPIPITENDGDKSSFGNKRRSRKQSQPSHLSNKTNALENNTKDRKPLFVCKDISAGSRHSLIVMIDCQNYDFIPGQYDEDGNPIKHPKPTKKLYTVGLNQVALCEEPGNQEPVEVPWNWKLRSLRQILAGHGNSFIVTKKGVVYSWGHGNFGVLGHGVCESIEIPRRIKTLEMLKVKQIATGAAHTVALVEDGSPSRALFSWGRNHKGQLGQGFESVMEMIPRAIDFSKVANFKLKQVSCGQHHCIALLTIKKAKGNLSVIYAWGDESKGQLGSGDASSRMRPQENRWLTKFCASRKMYIKKIAAGGYHNLTLMSGSGQVVAWGAGDYGQLGSGFLWDDATPRFVVNLDHVVDISAGLRHSMAIGENPSDVYAWGYNGYGELGLGDVNIRLGATKVSAFRFSRVRAISCGDRHTLVMMSHKPIRYKEDLTLKPYFKILQSGGANNMALLKKLKWTMSKKGLDSNALDKADSIIPNQAGSEDKEVKNLTFDKGLRYCLDTFVDPMDWRRKGLETCYECSSKDVKYKSVCLSCARNCVYMFKLRPYIRSRSSRDLCDCHTSGKCVSLWSTIREGFDNFADKEPVVDSCIGPNVVRALLQFLRAPYLVESSDVDDCLLTLAEGRNEHFSSPRIKAVPFELWYRKFYGQEELPTTT